MFLEDDWTSMVYRCRFGSVFTDVRGERYWTTRRDACDALLNASLRLGRKTDSRTWEIVAA